ncbi:predicted protein [Thalassiosira pseudonana CCMP1335]|uniref:Aromatic amino acid beta-eliminating lyase/threonine aldolase domain-containing protein n=1 Tax=Thalassiosira pseudonana TaxID=35128 RepID=B8BWZ2_THAPS|nr:predicted protein [Thalassiosira pseudonana CCMP1335]EED94114.1 predicted protein [Thalassiosira pseudonana CCMP1335]
MVTLSSTKVLQLLYASLLTFDFLAAASSTFGYGTAGVVSFVGRATIGARGQSPSNVRRSTNAARSSIQKSYATDASDDVPMKDLIDLQTHTVRPSPSDVLSHLSKACDLLGIEAYDVYGDFTSIEDQSYLRKFETEVATCFGREDAVFCLSGGMAQSIALMIHAQSDTTTTTNDNDGTLAFACHPTSHLLLHENEAFSELLGMEAVIIDPDDMDAASTQQTKYDPEVFKSEGYCGMTPMRLHHAERLISALDGSKMSGDSFSTYPSNIPVTSTTVSTLIVELPHREIGGKLVPWKEVEEMSHLCRGRKIKFHCDGARIFEASAGYG